MKKTLTAPAIDNYIEWLGGVRYGEFQFEYTYDTKAYEHIDEIFELLKKVAPTREGQIWDLWLYADRGSVSDFADIDDEDARDYYGFTNQEELEKVWKEYFPSDVKWYDFCAVEHEDGQYRAIFLAHKQVIAVDKRETKNGNEYEITEFTAWLLSALKEVLAELDAGTYNDKVNKNLPPELRTGTIRRKDYFDLFPEYRKAFFDGLTQGDIEAFIQYAKEEPKREESTIGHVQSMTANDYFNMCAIGYKANNYKDCTLVPKEQYKRNADGRDEGLTQIDPDSAEAFDLWYSSPRGGGHPWEIFPGGNSTHISLYVCKDKKGYYYILSGNSDERCIETIRMYLALRKNEIFVYLPGSEVLIDRLLETEKIGIVPDGIFPRYCDTLFPGEEINSFMNLPYEQKDKEKMLPFCEWQQLKEIRLKG